MSTSDNSTSTDMKSGTSGDAKIQKKFHGASTKKRTGEANETRPVRVGHFTIGGPNFNVIAGPCSIESQGQFSTTANEVKKSGANILRGGVYKMRTSPNSFQGLGEEALKIARETSRSLGMPMVVEITDPRQIETFYDVVDMYQVGSRNMYNYSLLKELGQLDKPVLLKRGFSALIEEWILAAEYIVGGGNQNVILCERGIRSFEKITRNTLDLAAVAYAKQNSPFPVVVDPSHATGVPSLITPMSLAAAAAGADGLIIEVHPNPVEAKSDGFQALTPDNFQSLMSQLQKILKVLERPLEVLAH